MVYQMSLTQADGHFGRVTLTRCFKAMRHHAIKMHEHRQNKASAEQFYRLYFLVCVLKCVVCTENVFKGNKHIK